MYFFLPLPQYRFDMMTKMRMKVPNRILHLNRAYQYLFECRVASLRNWPPHLSRILTVFIQIKEYIYFLYPIFRYNQLTVINLYIIPFLSLSPFLLDIYLSRFQTFVVVSKGKDIFRFSATDAMYALDPFNPIRRVAIYILVHPLFSLFIITTILVNCILMIMPTTPAVESTEWVNIYHYLSIYQFFHSFCI